MRLYYRIGSSVRTKVAKHGIPAGTTGTITEVDQTSTPYKFTADYSNDYQAWYSINELETAGCCLSCEYKATDLRGDDSTSCRCIESRYYAARIEHPESHSCPWWKNTEAVKVSEDINKSSKTSESSLQEKLAPNILDEIYAKENQVVAEVMKTIENQIRLAYCCGLNEGMDVKILTYQNGFRAGVKSARDLIDEKMEEDETDGKSDRPVEP